MRLMVLLVGLSCVGCQQVWVERPAWLPRFRPLHNDAGTVTLLVTELHVRNSDPAAVERLFAELDEQFLPLEHVARLRELGLRVGLATGPEPIWSRMDKNDFVQPPQEKHLAVSLGRACMLPLKEHAGSVVCQGDLGSRVRPGELLQPRFFLLIEPVGLDQNLLSVRLTMAVQHGPLALLPRPLEDRSGWMLRPGRQEERVTASSCQISIGPQAVLAMTGDATRPDSVGALAFCDWERSSLAVLFIRPVHLPPSAVGNRAGSTSPVGELPGPTPLAWQTLQSFPHKHVRRGQSPP
ncbi:MAG: hypothetical protein C4297_11530 [Gemmataceae bacterium]